MSQSRKASMLEATANIAIGYLVAIAAQAIILPLFGFHATLTEHAQIAGLFTAISLIRSYLLRRMFNWFTLKALRDEINA
jgi:hypothetical protein